MITEQKNLIIPIKDLSATSHLQTLVDLLRHQATHRPEQVVYTYLEDGESIELNITHAELDRQARAIAGRLQALNAAGERVLLLYPTGLDFIAAFFGCLYAGVIAVPAFPPRLNRPSPRIQGIVTDSGATIALTTTSFAESLTRRFNHIPALANLHWINSDRIPAGTEDTWHAPPISPDTIAFLQYTSGSTSTPKGVMVSHGNLMYNMAMIQHGFHLITGDIGAFWLPSYHDMGLIGGILTPLYISGQAILMAPVAFLQKPLRWLQMISHYKGTIIGAPNFAYQLCVDKITTEQCAGLDLSSLKTTFCGAEPIRAETLRRFAEKFSPIGFPEASFYPCYGMAEATLIVSGGDGPAVPTTCTIHRTSLEHNQPTLADPSDPDAQEMVSCGQALLGQEIQIVNPQTLNPCPAGVVGEIWVTGANIAQGYWNRPEQTAAAFQFYLEQKGPYLRTGDLGFILDNQLYITGRLKDLIIIRGRNHYPQDIELTVENSHPAIEPGMGATFAIDHEGQEKLVIVHELSRAGRHHNTDQVLATIRAAVAQNHELQPHAIQLLKPMSIPKTSSGKIKRHACKEEFLNGTLAVISEWRESESSPPPQSSQPKPAPQNDPLPITQWLVERLAAQLHLAPEQIDIHQPFVNYGLDSIQAVSLSGDLENWLQRPLDPTLIWDYPTIAELAAHLTGRAPQLPPLNQPPPANNEPIAIIGLSCRMPGANTPAEFWQLLYTGRDAISEVPPNRWPIEQFYAADPATPGKMNTRWGGFLSQVDQFDPHFFGIAPREATRMDPQQRLLLEVAWEALENAGIPPGRIANTQTGVFVGISSYDYSRLQFSHPDLIDAYAGTGNAHSIAANRLSYLLDLRGPSMAVDTACSSSLVAVHQAIQSLRNGESNLALAGGVNILLLPELTITFSQARMMAANGRCKTFDAAADGYVRGEGAGMVVLKRLKDALNDGDPILALLRGSAVNQDGRSNGLTAPNGLAQQAVIRRALANAGLSPAGIQYIEAHGTGTPLGDPIEIHALRTVLDQDHPAGQPYFVGSVKTNIGHLEAAAGIAGLIKVVLALQHQTIPPHLHLQKLNPYIRLDGSSLTIPTSPTPWPAGDELRLAGVSSFGFGGTNAHLLVSDFSPPLSDEPTINRPGHILALSAKSPTALAQLVNRYANLEISDLPNLCYSANTGREHFAHRAAFVATTPAQLHQQLQNLQPTSPKPSPKVAFLFTGQGAQYPGMAAQLYQTQPTFRAVLNRCAAVLAAHLDQPILPLILGDNPILAQTVYTQPALFAVELALSELWRSWGVEPAIVLGHSVGEYVAACVAGVFSLEDGLKLIAARGRLMQSLSRPGSMINVFASESQVRQILNNSQVDIASVNGPQHLVIAGPTADITAALLALNKANIESRPLTVSHAFHSRLMEPMLAEFEQIASTVNYQTPRLPLISNVTGRVMSEAPQASYWRDHIRATVQFAAGVETLVEQKVNIGLEIGPQPHLISIARRAQPGLLWLPSLRQGQDNWEGLLSSLAQLYTAGLTINWAGFDQDYPRRRLPFLPNYPFEREQYWLEGIATHNKWPAATAPSTAIHRLPVMLPIYEASLDSGGLPAALTTIANEFWGQGQHEIIGLMGTLSGRERCQILLTPLTPDQATAQIFTAKDDQWLLQATAQLKANRQTPAPNQAPKNLGSNLTDFLQQQVAQVLGINPDRLDPNHPLDMLGLDSLMAIELRNRLEKHLGLTLPVVVFLEGPTIHGLVEQLAQTKPRSAASTISPAGDDQPAPLSVNQQAMWFLDQLLPSGLAFNVAGAVRLIGQLDIPALERAFEQLVERHPALRTTFSLVESRPVQIIHPHSFVLFERLDMADWSEAARLAYLREEAYRPFDSEHGPLLRLLLADLSRPDEHILLLSVAHIVTDFWSMSLLVQELYLLYRAEMAGLAANLPRPELTYADFARWQATMLQSPESEQHRQYWLNRLAGQLPLLNLPLDHPRPLNQTFQGDTLTHHFGPTLGDQLKAFSQSQGATLYMTLLAAFQVLLHRYTGQDDLLTGSLLTGRERPEWANLVGYFINPLAIRADLSGNPTFAQFLGQVRQRVLEAIAHQDYPLPLLAEQLNLNRDPGRPPIFETMFIMQKAQVLEAQGLSGFALGLPAAQLKLDGLSVESLAIGGLPAQLDLTLMMAETPAGLAAAFHYNTALFEASSLSRMAAHLQSLLTAIVTNPNTPIDHLPLLDPAGQQLLAAWNDTATPYPAGLCLHQLFEQQVARTPSAIAAQYANQSLTYAQLNQQADQLAEVLRSLGVGREKLVGVCLERSLEMLVALLAVLKAGGAYVPLDPAFPSERLAWMVEDARPGVILSDGSYTTADPTWHVRLSYQTLQLWGNDQLPPDPRPATPDSLAYVIYTSGSTGRPKGVQIPHRAMVNFLSSMANRPGLTSADSLLAVTTLSFDIAGLELFLPLCVGARVIIVSRETAGDGSGLLEAIARTGATVMQATPATWRMLLEAGWGQQPRLAKILCGGEALPRDLADSLLARCDALWNMYGPTETTVWSAVGRVEAGHGPLAIGRPIANTQLYILDPAGQPVPAGVVGDLYIGGDGLARGYLNRPELTQEKFTAGPPPLYKTGDLARYLADGQIIFLGRGDQQVKIRGYRIELGEIEAALGQHPAVRQAVVVAREERPGDKRLVAYVVEREKPTLAYRQFLAQKLPDYMIPAAFVSLPALPLTPNNKIDRKALPRPEQLTEPTPHYLAPQTPLEQRLADLLATVLGIEKVGLHDNFFDLGGNSLLATRLIFQAREKFQTPIPLRQLFAEPTVAGLVKVIQADQPSNGHRALFEAISLDELRAEARLDPTIVPAGHWQPTNPSAILLTGATGFVGAFLLRDLIQRTTAMVYCLVRADDEESGRERLRRNLSRYGLWDEAFANRLQIVLGDLGRPRLGLAAEQLDQLAEQLDAIYHNGAMVNFVYPYQAHKAANVQGTLEMIRLACGHHSKPLHFVSTLSVFHTGNHDTGRVFGEEDELEQVGVPFGGYAQSKWVAEKLVMEAGRRGLPIAIYRPGLVSGDSRSGAWNQDDMMSTLARISLALGVLPELEVMVDLVPVDYVSAAIGHLSGRDDSIGHIFHLANPSPLPYKQLLAWVKQQGVAIRPVSFAQWRDTLALLAAQAGENPFLPLLEEVSVDQVFMPAIDCRNTLAGLAGSPIRCHPVNGDLLRIYWQQVVSGEWEAAGSQ